MDDVADQKAFSVAFRDGETAAAARLSAVMGAEGVKGDAGRMTAALNLATASPDMTIENIVAFVMHHVSAVASTLSAPESYATARVAASEMAQQRWTQSAQDQARQLNTAAAAQITLHVLPEHTE